jgi:hypothetical protein
LIEGLSGPIVAPMIDGNPGGSGMGASASRTTSAH